MVDCLLLLWLCYGKVYGGLLNVLWVIQYFPLKLSLRSWVFVSIAHIYLRWNFIVSGCFVKPLVQMELKFFDNKIYFVFALVLMLIIFAPLFLKLFIYYHLMIWWFVQSIKMVKLWITYITAWRGIYMLLQLFFHNLFQILSNFLKKMIIFFIKMYKS